MNNLRRDFLQRYADFRVEVPEGKQGLYEIKRVETSKRQAEVDNIVAYVMKTDRYTKPGIYTQLIRYGALGNPDNKAIVMTDHPCEVADHAALVAYAEAHAPLERVLINGLGIGVAIDLLAPFVQRFTIVELSASVIRLVAPYYQERYPGKIDIVHHDALTYRPPKGARYNAVFHDIWDFISPNNLAEMRHLQRRYGRLCDWQESWARVYCERAQRQRALHPEQYKEEIDVQDVYRAVNTLFGSVDPLVALAEELQP